MIILIVLMLSLIYAICGFVKTNSELNSEFLSSNKAFFVCSFFCILCLVDILNLHYSLLLNLIGNDKALSHYSYISSSNHFIISLDIIYLFSSIMFIIYHDLKIGKPLTAR